MPGEEAVSGLLLPVVPFRMPSLRDVLLPLPFFAFVGVCLAAGQALGMFPPGEGVGRTRPGSVGTLAPRWPRGLCSLPQHLPG